MKRIENKYGYFTENCREFVITDPRTPRPWFNYMWNKEYAGLISHTGGGFSYLECPRDNRITRMRYNSLPWDRPGRYVIIKDIYSSEHWSLSWAPTINKKYDKYECRHGQGYTTIKTEMQDIEGEITYFVPADANAEIWRVKLKNNSDKKRKLQIYSFTELVMGNALNDIINQPNDKHFTEIKFNKDKETLYATRRYWVLNKKVSVAQPNIDWGYYALFTTTLPVKGFDGSLDKFIGKWRSEENPQAIENGRMGNTEITAGDPIAALKSEIELEPGEEKDFAVILGTASKEENDPYKALNWDDLKKIETIDKKFEDVKAKWDKYLNSFKCETPDEKLNTMLNVWNPYQTAVTFDMARNAGYYHGGLLFGTGMRDQFQDILGKVIAEPEVVRERLLNALEYQYIDGSTLHNFFKLVGIGERTNHSDTPLWIPFGIVEYINETGDMSILDEKVPYLDEGEGTVYEHMVNAVDFALSATTERGLPKIMNGDWNDTLDHIGPQGKGETVWGAFFLAYVISKTFELLAERKDTGTLDRWNAEYEKLGKVINDTCWDGEWYLRAFRDNGEPVGSAKHKQGKLFLNAQTFSVLSGLAPKERAEKALKACREHLTTPYGMQIVWPAYIEVEDSVGLISRCVPGKKENGAVFNHASSWFVLASVLNGDPKTANEIYSKMLPVNSSEDIDAYETEPYVYSEYITSPVHETENQASHSWLTGSAVWMLRIGIDYILGFRTSIKGITIEPNIPAAWKEYSAERNFRGKRIKLKVKNPDGRNSGVSEIKVNGKEKKNALIIPDDYEDTVINVEITL